MIIPIIVATRSFAQDLKLQVIRDYRQVFAVAASNEQVFFATNSGILRYNKGKDGWDLPVVSSRLFGWDDVDHIQATNFGELSAHTTLGWFVFDALTDSWFPSAEPTGDKVYTSIVPPDNLQGPPGSITLGGGRFLDVASREYRIIDIIDDGSGYYWIATNGAGPARTRVASGVIEELTVGLAQPRADVLTRAGDSVWCGGIQTFNRGGLTSISSSLSQFTHVRTGTSRGLPRLDIQSLIVSGDTLLCGTEHGLCVVLPEIEQIVQTITTTSGLPSERITSLARDGDSLFVGTDYGPAVIWHHRDSVRLIRPATLGNALIYDLSLIDNRLWIATDRGCFRWRRDTDQLQNFLDSTRTLFGRVFDLQATSDRIWFVSPTSLVWLDRTSGEQGIIRDAAPGRKYRALAANESLVAFSTERGVTVTSYHTRRQDSREVLLDDGLPSAQVISLLFVDDFLWIGTDQGVARLDCTLLGLHD